MTRREAPLDGIITMRALLNELVTRDMDAKVSFGFYQANPMIDERDSYHMLMIGKRVPTHYGSRFTADEALWTCGKEGNDFYFRNVEDYLFNGYDEPTVRELINKLISLNPEDELVLRGSFYTPSISYRSNRLVKA
jgi:hypothetical protein